VQPESATWVYFQKGEKGERGEREEGKGRDGGGARQAKLLIKTLTLQVIPSSTLHQGKKNLQNKNHNSTSKSKTNKSLSKQNYNFKSHFYRSYIIL
jgi:hypothetical protein